MNGDAILGALLAVSLILNVLQWQGLLEPSNVHDDDEGPWHRGMYT
jgi:hypothetical protein